MMHGWLDTVWEYYEKAKAKLYAELGKLLGLRSEILKARDRAIALHRAAERTGNGLLIRAAAELRAQADEVYQDQMAVEGKVMEARERVGAVDAGKSASGVGALPIAAIMAAAAVVVSAAAAVVVHTQKVGLLKRALDSLEKRIISSADFEAVAGGAGLLPSLPQMGGIAIAAAVVIGGIVLLRRRRPAR